MRVKTVTQAAGGNTDDRVGLRIVGRGIAAKHFQRNRRLPQRYVITRHAFFDEIPQITACGWARGAARRCRPGGRVPLDQRGQRGGTCGGHIPNLTDRGLPHDGDVTCCYVDCARYLGIVSHPMNPRHPRSPMPQSNLLRPWLRSLTGAGFGALLALGASAAFAPQQQPSRSGLTPITTRRPVARWSSAASRCPGSKLRSTPRHDDDGDRHGRCHHPANLRRRHLRRANHGERWRLGGRDDDRDRQRGPD